MQETARQPKPREADDLREHSQMLALLPAQQNIHRDCLVPRHGRAADRGIPLPASMRRRDDERLTAAIPQRLQPVQKSRCMPIGAVAEPATTTTSEFRDLEFRPGPSVAQR